VGFGAAVSIFWLVGVAFIVIAASQAFRCGRRWWEGRRSSDWPSVDGVILHSGVGEERVWSGGSSRTRLVYVPEIRYAYVVEGHTFEGDAVAVRRPESSFRTVIERIVDAYPVEHRVRVHHHPARPRRAVLRAGAAGRDALEFIGAALVGAVGATLSGWSASLGGGPDGAFALLHDLVAAMR
jgi:hypothetical protein